VDYYERLFTLERVVGHVGCLDFLECWVTNEMNEALSRPFTEVEIKTALFQMSPLKALGSDGFNVDFFQKKLGHSCPGGLHSYTPLTY
jgi:hypothetical protein